MTDADQPREISRRTITTVRAWSVPAIALAVMAPSAAASPAPSGTLNIAAVGATSGDAVTYWFVTVQNTSRSDIPAGGLQLICPKSADYRIADTSSSTFTWSKADTGSAFVYTYNASLYGPADAPEFRFEFKRWPPDNTGTPIVNLTATASGFQSASRGLEVPY